MVTVFTGKPSIDKQQFLFNTIKKMNKVTVITPEQNTLALERELIDTLALPGMIDIQVVSFSRLLKRLSGIFEPEDVMVTSIGKRILFSQILREKRGSFKLFSGYEKMGFYDELMSTIDRLEIDQIEPEALYKLSSDAKGELLQAKLSDIALIYETYLEKVQGSFFDQKRQLELFKEHGMDFRLVDENVFLMGFKHLDNVHLEMLKAMDKKADIYLDLPLAEGELYHVPQNTLNRLERYFEVKNIPIIQSEAPYSTLSEAILSGDEATVKAPRFFEAEDQYEEVEFIGLDILKKVSEEGLGLGDIRILTTDINRYGFLFKSTFNKLGIDLFLDERKLLSQSRMIKSVLSLLKVFLRGFRRVDVLSYLKSSVHRELEEKLDTFENYLLSQGVLDFKEDVTFFHEDMEELRRLWITPLLKKASLFKDKRSIREFSESFLELLISLEYPEKIQEEQARFHELDLLEEELIMAQAWNTLYEILMQLRILSDDEPINYKDFKTILERAITDATIGIIPPSEGKVVLAEVHRTTHQVCKVLYFSGMNEHLLPKSYGDTALLKEKEKEEILNMGYDFHDTSDFKESLDAIDQHLALSLVEEELVLSFAKSDYSSNTMKESMYYGRAKDLVEKPLIEKGLGNHYFYHEDLLRRYSYEALFENREESLYITEEELDTYTRDINRVQTPSIVKRNEEEFKASVSRLEKFRQCPFSYFINYDLQAKERESFELESMILGSLHHEVVEKALQAMMDGHVTMKELPNYIENLFRELLLEEDKKVFLSSASNRYLVSRAKRVARFVLNVIHKQVEKSPFKPKYFEIPVSTPLKGYDFYGRVDRVDTLGNEYKVIDYKSGNKTFNLSRIYQGIDLQLALYAGSLKKVLDKRFDSDLSLAGIYYFNIKDPFVKKGEDREENLSLSGIDIKGKADKGALSKGAFQHLYKRVEDMSETLIEEINEGDARVRPLRYQQTMACDYCKFHSICRFDEFQRGFNVLDIEHKRDTEIIKELEETHEVD